MGFTRMLKQSIKRSDLLGAPATLRNRGEPYYQSLFGGITTIILFILFTAIFILKLRSMIILQDINSSGALKNNQNDTTSIDNFFFGITLPYMTYSEMTTFFKIQLSLIQSGKPDVPITLINCTQQMWNSRQIYSDFLYSGYLCPQQTNLLKIYKTSSKQAYLKLSIDCSDCSDPVFQNFSQTIQENYDLFSADIEMINTIISQAQQNPISYYIDTIPVSTFGANLGMRAEIQLTPYQIDTDVSFLPYSKQQTLTGFYISNKFSTKTLLYSGTYAEFKFSKSKLQDTITREYGKFDDLLSYVGGLFALLFVVFAFFLGPYNQFKYELMVSEAIFRNESLDNVNKITEANWNFWTYLKYIVYDWLDFFGCPPKKWKQMKQFNESRQEALYLLDAKYLMKRIRYLETAVNILLPKNKQICLRLIDTPQIETIRKQRKIMELFDEYQQHKNHQKQKAKKLADILLQKTVIHTIYQFAKPSDKYLQAKTVDLQKWKEEVSDSQYIEDEEVKHQIQKAIKQMIEKKEVDDQYNQIYDLMENDFKGWASFDNANNSEGQLIREQAKIDTLLQGIKLKNIPKSASNKSKSEKSQKQKQQMNLDNFENIENIGSSKNFKQ